MNKKIAVISVLALTVAVGTGSTLAYFTSQDTATNQITTGNVSIAVKEYKKDADTGKLTDYSDPLMPIVPGDNISKIVKVENTGSGDAYIRAKIDVSFTDSGASDGQAQALSTDKVILDINKDYWTYNSEDGYYYYKDSVAKGGQTQDLFSNVKFDESAGNEYQNQKLKIKINAEAIQSKNNNLTNHFQTN